MHKMHINVNGCFIGFPALIFPFMTRFIWFVIVLAAVCVPGRPFIAAPSAAPSTRAGISAAIATPRQDANSKLAHEQLVAKAKAGGIDLYFLGDSITRRWGCNDPQWSALLANWTENLHGWNAGNFGWGADQIQNMLWRIKHGEL